MRLIRDQGWPTLECKASDRVGGRIECPGVLSQHELSRVYDAADIYIDGFPFGTTTALLEAGARAIPVVLAPGIYPAPCGTDGVALDDIVNRASTIDEYTNSVLDLAAKPGQRALEGNTVRTAVASHHAGLS